MKVFKIWTLIVLVSVLTAGCVVHRNRQTDVLFSQYFLHYGRICSTEHWQWRTKCLQEDGAHVSFLGDHVFVIIPTQRVFNTTTSANLKETALLHDLIAFLNCYQKLTVTVKGYVGTFGTYRQNIALSKKQAKVLAEYLWRQGLDTRVITATGEGFKTDSQGMHLNQIEISFKQLP
jgi:intracellular multiplication protein IcmN